MRRARVLVVDDSAVVRQVLGALLAADPALELLGAVADPIFAMARMRVAWPDVIVLDVEMPRMDGISFLRRIMAERPTPVVICSSLTVRGAQVTVDALAAGAVAIVPKPALRVRESIVHAAPEITQAVRVAARTNVRALHARSLPPAQATALAETTESVVAIGTSTGGTHALEAVLRALPEACPGIVVVQHMPEKFTAAFARRLDGLCRITVREASDGERLLPGHVLIAPGGRHLSLTRSGARYHVEVRRGPPVNRHCPSVNVLFRSVARCAGGNATGILMTGMGDDGARGLLEMREAGARTLAQDEASCVVFGMPKEAIRLGATQEVVALDRIPAEIVRAGQRAAGA